MKRTVLIAATAATAMLFATAARADETRQIRTSDLDLATAAGQVELDNRIERAARAVCKVERTGSRISSVDGECRAKAAASTRAALAARGLLTKSGG